MLAGPGMRAQEIANLAWALAVMGEADVVLLKDLLRSAQAQSKDITLIESHQLYQVSASLYFVETLKACSHMAEAGQRKR